MYEKDNFLPTAPIHPMHLFPQRYYSTVVIPDVTIIQYIIINTQCFH